jgi:hypothetical protein
MPAGLGAAGWLCIVLEDTMGTYLPPTTAGAIWVPILDENVAYTEEAYYSQQIRQQTVDIERTQGFYHVEGPISMEFDANYAPYWLYCSRHTIAATPGTPNLYTFTPSTAGAAFTQGGGPRTASITIVRNGIGFGYAGCVIPQMEFTIEEGVLRFNVTVFGLSEQEPVALGSPTWLDPSLLGAAHHTVYVDVGGLAPAFATPSEEFNGFTATFEHNATAENRLNGERSATYIAYHKTDATFDSELDFLDRSEYDKFVDNDRIAVRFVSFKGGTGFANCDEGVQITFYNAAYDTYPVQLSGLADLVMAQTTGRGLIIAGGDPYKIEVKSDVIPSAVQS